MTLLPDKIVEIVQQNIWLLKICFFKDKTINKTV